MKFKEQRELVEGLRALADFIEAHPELPIEDEEIKFNPWLYDDSSWDNRDHHKTAKEKMAIAARAMGTASKEFKYEYLDVTKSFGPRVKLEFTTNRQAFCRRVVIETKEIPARLVPARTEEVVEWICDDPILAG